MAFPANPAQNDQYVIGTKTWEYDGTTWTFVGSTTGPSSLVGGAFVTGHGSGSVTVSAGADAANKNILVWSRTAGGYSGGGTTPNPGSIQIVTADSSGQFTVNQDPTNQQNGYSTAWYYAYIN